MRAIRVLCLSSVIAVPSSYDALASRASMKEHRCYSATHPPMSVSAEERKTLDRGEMIFVDSIELPGRSWPRVCTYQFIKAGSESSIAVLTDFARQHDYIPRVIHSEVVPSTSKSFIRHVAYVIDLPLAGDEVDTLREEVGRMGGGSEGYTLTWHALASSGTNAIDGSATFVPWHNASTGGNGTLMIYEQAVDPKGWVTRVWFIKRRGLDAVRDATTAIARQVEMEVASQPAVLANQIADFRETLARAP